MLTIPFQYTHSNDRIKLLIYYFGERLKPNFWSAHLHLLQWPPMGSWIYICSTVSGYKLLNIRLQKCLHVEPVLCDRVGEDQNKAKINLYICNAAVTTMIVITMVVMFNQHFINGASCYGLWPSRSLHTWPTYVET